MFASLKKNKPVDEPKPERKTIDRFELMQELGKGAQGIVYLANDTKLNRQVAIKTLLHKNRDGEQIMNEARHVSALQHPNIIPLYEIGTHNERPFLVYPYVKGRTLKDYIDSGEKLTVIQGIKIILGVLDGLAHAHEKGIIHRDLNPSNILLDENKTPRIMDFGISTFASNNTSDETIVGTVQYMAPEQLNKQATGAWSDIFSIGVIFFEMLTNHSLFKADNTMVSIYKILNENILPPSSRNKVIDKTLDQIVLKSLAREKAARYNDALDMKLDLETYIDDETGTAKETPTQVNEQVAREQATVLLLKRSLDKNKEFPVMGNSIAQIMEVSNGEGCADKLAEIILRDQSLSSKILSLVNSSGYGQFGGEINTISRAVVILGLNQIQSLSVSIMIFEKLNNGPMADTLKSNACQSFLSAIFAKKLVPRKSAINSEEAFLASMFHNLGKQVTIYFLPDEYNEILNLVIEKGIDEDQASKRVLGINFANIGQLIAVEWQLPKNIILGIQPKPKKIIKKPSENKDYLALISSLTNEIVQAAACGNNALAERELKLIIKRYENGFALNLEKVLQMLKVLFQILINYCEIVGINHNKNTFCKNFISFVNSDYEFDSEEHTAATNNEAEHSETILTRGIAEVTSMMFKDYSLSALLKSIVNTIKDGTDCEHALLFLKDKVNGEMRAQIGAGNEIDTVMKRFHFHQNESDDIFNQVLNKKKDLFIPEVVNSPLLNQIPDWCKKVTLPKNLLLYPLIINDVSIGLIYVDNAKQLSSKAKQIFTHIDTLRNQAAMAIKQKQ